MKGFRVGASARWKEAPSIGFGEVGGFFDTDQVLFGEEQFFTDTFLTYSGKMKNDTRWDATLRVRNLFNEKGWYPNTAIDDGTGEPYFLQQIFLQPRTYELSMRFRY